MIAINEQLPDEHWMQISEAGPHEISVLEHLAGKRAVIFGVPGAFTPTCDQKHLRGFIDESKAMKAKKIDKLICVSVNDPFVMQAWGKISGAFHAGIEMMSDPHASFTKAIGLDFHAPEAGLLSRSKRYSMLVEDTITVRIDVEKAPGICAVSSAKSFFGAI